MVHFKLKVVNIITVSYITELEEDRRGAIQLQEKLDLCTGQWREVSRLHEIRRDFSPSRQLHPLECTRQEIAVAIRRMTLGFFIFWVKTVKCCVKVRFYTQRNATNQILNLVKKFKKPQCDLFSFVEKDFYVENYLFHWLLKR